MAKICTVCQGRGRWQETTHAKDGHIEFVWHECGACNMTGIKQEPEDGEDWDIGGSSYADDE